NWHDTTYSPNDTLLQKIYMHNFYIVTDTNIVDDYDSVYTIRPIYEDEEGYQLTPTKDIVLQFKPSIEQGLKNSIISTYNLTFLESSASFERYKTTNDNVFATAQGIFESELVEFCHPDFASS